MTIRINGCAGGSSVATTGFTNLVIASGGTLTFGSTGNAYFQWVDPDTLVLKVLGSTAHTWTGNVVIPDNTGIPMGIGLAITYPN